MKWANLGWANLDPVNVVGQTTKGREPVAQVWTQYYVSEFPKVIRDNVFLLDVILLTKFLHYSLRFAN